MDWSRHCTWNHRDSAYVSLSYIEYDPELLVLNMTLIGAKHMVYSTSNGCFFHALWALRSEVLCVALPLA